MRLGKLRCITLWATLLAGLANLSLATAQPLLISPAQLTESAKIEAPPAEPFVNKREQNAELLRVAQRNLEAADPADSAAAEKVALFQSLDTVFVQQEAVDQQIKDLQARKAELTAEVQSAAGPIAEKPAYSFVELDQLKDELASERVRAGLAGDRLAAAKAAVEKAQRAFDDSDTKRRQAQEALEAAKDVPAAGELATAAEVARQAARLAAETLALRKREVVREELSLDVQRLAIERREKQVAGLSPLVTFSEANYQDQLADIKKKEESANKSLQRAQAALHNADMQLRTAQQEHDTASGDRTVLEEKLVAARRAREKLADDIDSHTQRLQRLAQLRLAWSRRFKTASANHATPDKQAYDELKSWQKETRAVLDELAADLRAQILQMRDLRSSLTSVTKKAEAAKDGPAELLTWLDAQRRHVEAMLRIHETNLVTIETSRRVHEKLLEEVGRGVQILNPKSLALGVWHQVDHVWKQEITKIDDRSITVGKVITCISVFVGGWVVSRVFSGLFANRILRRFRLSKDATAAVRALVFYTLLATATLMALRTVNVPLTAFTILGGALAIGVGFGSQALVNNFIGGLIMLAERPVRLGERIIFGNFDGVVEDVGFRCTKLRTAADHLITIPNSTLVNDSIENAARRRTIRRTMNIAISTDTPRDRMAAVLQAIRDVLDEKEIRERIHPIVGFEEFPPRVFFQEIRADGLIIQVVYWYAPPNTWEYMEHAELVNLRIMEELERLGVEFAGPPKTLLLTSDPKRERGARVA